MHESLTEREREVARLVSEGKTNGEIANELVIEESTVETHMHHILQKLSLRNRVLLSQWYRDHEGEREA